MFLFYFIYFFSANKRSIYCWWRDLKPVCMWVCNNVCDWVSRLEYLFMFSSSGQSSSLLIKKHISFKILGSQKHWKPVESDIAVLVLQSCNGNQWCNVSHLLMFINEYTAENNHFQWAMLFSWHKFITFVMSASISLTLSKEHQASQP